MKKIAFVFSFILFVAFVNAQQAGTAKPQTTEASKADEHAKCSGHGKQACCAGKTEASASTCNHDGKKSCSADQKAACCAGKTETSATCAHDGKKACTADQKAACCQKGGHANGKCEHHDGQKEEPHKN